MKHLLDFNRESLENLTIDAILRNNRINLSRYETLHQDLIYSIVALNNLKTFSMNRSTIFYESASWLKLTSLIEKKKGFQRLTDLTLKSKFNYFC